MNSLQIETWAIRIIENVKAGKPNEDSRVELKSGWPDPQKTARRLAGHANFARGEPILWIIGVDQKDGTIYDVPHVEIATWYSQVQAEFDENHSPSLKDLNISYDGSTLVALLFETEGFPFIVKAQNERLEIPWREGTRTRSAKRTDLVKLLVPLQFLPSFELFSIEVSLDRSGNQEFYWIIQGELFIEPEVEARLVIPFHRCTAQLENSTLRSSVVFENLTLRSKYIDARMIESSRDELLVYGPGTITLGAQVPAVNLPDNLGGDMQVDIRLHPVGAEYPAIINLRLDKAAISHDDIHRLHRWKAQRLSTPPDIQLFP